MIPDAIFTPWEVISPAFRRAITSPPAEPIFHTQTFAGYVRESLIDKLGIKAGMTVSLVNLPNDFDNTLGNFPENIKIHLEAIKSIDLTIWFCQSREESVNQINDIAAQAFSDPIWIAWPK